jgi:hypothetical protein
LHYLFCICVNDNIKVPIIDMVHFSGFCFCLLLLLVLPCCYSFLGFRVLGFKANFILQASRTNNPHIRLI